MNWESLFKELGKCTAKRLFTSDDGAQYRQVRVLTEYETSFSSDTLYFSDWETYVRASLPERISVILYSKDTVDIRSVLKNTFNSAVYYAEDEYRAFYDLCVKLFNEDHRLDRELHSLSELVFKNEDLFVLSNKIAEIYGHPVNIIDTTYSVIAFSTNIQYDIDDLKKDDFRIGGFIPPEILRTLNIERSGIRVFGNTMLISHLYGEFNHYRTPIYMNNVCIAYFSVYYLPSEEPSALEIQYLSRFSKYISLTMQMRDYNSLNKDNYYNSLFASLLTDRTMFERDWETRITAYGYRLKEKRYIFVADVSSIDEEKSVIKDFSITIHHIISNSIYAVIDRSIIFLGSFDRNDNTLPDIIASLNTLTDNFPKLRIGISSRFSRLTEIRGCVGQARDAIETGSLINKHAKVYRYDDYRLHNLVYTLSRNHDFEKFLLTELNDLSEYDKSHGSELLYTLYSVVTHPKGLAKVCDHLHIHRNTLYFRMAKIAEMTGLEYERADVSAAILISFAYMKLKGMIDFELIEE